jgi:hypothetical protein
MVNLAHAPRLPIGFSPVLDQRLIPGRIIIT